jgi:type II secretion system protein G
LINGQAGKSSIHVEGRRVRRGFTLIELLIVVAIIAVLAAIAVPNFLEAQTRAKVSRVKADLRTITTGLEAYAVDNNSHYPPNDLGYNVTPVQLSTPVTYLSNARQLPDPFSTKELIFRTKPINKPGIDPKDATLYTYTKIITQLDYYSNPSVQSDLPPEGIDTSTYNLGAEARYGQWRICSNGPDRQYARPNPVIGTDDFNPRNNPLFGCDVPYDPTNGTVSWGNILRTQIRNPIVDGH